MDSNKRSKRSLKPTFKFKQAMEDILSDDDVDVVDDQTFPNKQKVKLSPEEELAQDANLDWNDQILLGSRSMMAQQMADDSLSLPDEDVDEDSLQDDLDDQMLSPQCDDSALDVDEISIGDIKEKRRTANGDDEEKRWLDALESGDLDDNGDLIIKGKKDSTLLTARQRALLHGERDETLLELPSGYKQQELTEEQEKRRLIRAKRRREQAHEKKEKDKKQTLDRLLKKAENKKSKSVRDRRPQFPVFSYINTIESITISSPVEFDFPYEAKKHTIPPDPKLCQVDYCKNLRKYSCSRTGISLCSLECYKKNLISKGLS